MATDSARLDDPAKTDTDRAAVDGQFPELAVDALGGLASADDGEAAAIAAAIAAHLRDRRAAAAAAAAADGDDSESPRRWAFAGRLDAVGESAGRPTTTAPKDEWTAAGRADRF